MSRMLRWCALIWLFAAAAHAEHCAALLIGNGDYPKAALASPPLDIRAVGEALRKHGFVVTQVENLTAKGLKEAVAAFAKTIPTRGTALIYFSGYALPMTRPEDPLADNALLPIDGNAARPDLVAGSQTGTTQLLGILIKDSGSARNILIVDGCHAHPAQPTSQRKGLVKSGKPALESLAIHSAPVGEVLVPAAQGISPLARTLTDRLDSTLPLSEVFTKLGATTESTIGDLSSLALAPTKTIAVATELQAGSKAGDEWVSDRGMVFCWCPPRKFTIGSAEQSAAHEDDEVQADIEFPQGFWMGKFEFTRREMFGIKGGVYLSTGEHKLHPFNKPDAKLIETFLATLNQTAPAGWSYDLPTEAEWEYAARAGTSTDYFFGNDPADLAKFGNFADRTLRESDSFGEFPKNWKPKGPDAPVFFGDRQTGIFTYAHKTWNDGHATMALVGSYPPNPWGLHDVHGNIAEWTSTPYHPTRLIPEKPEPTIGAVCKGGSWLSTAAYCRSAMRSWSNIQENAVGLRFVLRRKASTPPNPITQVWTTLVPADFRSEAGATATISPDGTVLVGGKVAKDTYTVTATVPAGTEPKAIRLEALADPILPKQGPGRANDGRFMLCGFSVHWGAPGATEATKPVTILDALADYVQPNLRITDVIAGRFAANTGWGISGATGKDHVATFPIALPSRSGADGARWRHSYPGGDGPAAGSPLRFVLNHQDGATLGKFRLSIMHEGPAATTGAASPSTR